MRAIFLLSLFLLPFAGEAAGANPYSRSDSVALLTAQTTEPYTRTIKEVRVVRKKERSLTLFKFSDGSIWFNLADQPLDPIWTTGTEVQIDIPLHNDRFFRLTSAEGKLLPALPIYNRLPQITKIEWLDNRLSEDSPVTLQITLSDGALFQVRDWLRTVNPALKWNVGDAIFVSKQLYPAGHYILSVPTTQQRSSLRQAQLMIPPTSAPTPLPEIESAPLSDIPNCTLLQELNKQLQK